MCILQACITVCDLSLSKCVVSQAYVTICDLLIVFSKHLGDNPLMKPLVYEVDRSLQSVSYTHLTLPTKIGV